MGNKIESPKARAVGINHVALEVGNVNEALIFYGRFLDFVIHDQSDTAAFIYFGDQFINFMQSSNGHVDEKRHFGIAVDNKELVRQTLKEMGVAIMDGQFLDFLDPWGNRVEITTYVNIQYTKADHILRGMGLSNLVKTEQALVELRAKKMAPDSEH